MLPLALPGNAAKKRNVLDVKTEITDSNIIFPDSYEANTTKMMEGWYMKNYTATDDRYKRQGDVETSDAVIRERLANLPTVIDMPFNQIVRSYIDRYTKKGRSGVAAMLGLSIYYMPIFEQALEEAGLPLELKYLPVIESALDPTATSPVGAAGLWQFMLATGKGLGLEVSSLVDERRDPYLSSKKAAQFLKDLYDTYQDWSLVIAAYNCGPGTVNKAIRRAGGDPKEQDFWSIYYYLPSQTRGYVPMFIAANYVMNYYQYHNISPVLPTKPLVTDTIQVGERVHFQQISHVLDIPVEELRVLNPQFRNDMIPGTAARRYTLVLPSQQCNAYIMSEEDILAYDADRYRRRVDAEPGNQPSASLAQTIEEEGDGLSEEQRSADEEVALEPEQTAQPVVAQRAEQPAVQKQQRQTKTQTQTKGSVTVKHKVEAGESLADVAHLYGVSPEQIKEWNSLRRNAVRTGTQLTVYTTPEKARAAGAAAVTPAPSQKTWQADNSKTAKQTAPAKQAKETASKTSAKDKTAAKETAQTKKGKNSKNSQAEAETPAKKGKKGKNLADNDTKTGKKGKRQKAEPAAPTSHTVKSGENLTVIAKQHGVSVEDLRKSSGITGDKIRPGDEIKLPSKKGGKNAKASSKTSSSKASSKASSSKGSTKKKGKKK